RERVAERIGRFPRLTQRVVEPRFRMGRPAWVDAEDVDLDWHVADPSSTDPLADEDFRRAVGEILGERLDHLRPLWRFDLLPLTGGRLGLVARIHHAMADGVSAIHLMSGVLFDENEDPPAKPKAAARKAKNGKAPRPGAEGAQ